MKNIKKNKGFTIVELLIYCAIVSVAIIAIFAGYKIAFSNSVAYSNANLASEIAQDIRESYVYASNYKDLNTNSVISSGFISKERIAPNGKIYHKMNSDREGIIEINSVGRNNNTNGEGEYFRIRFTNVSQDSCVSLVKNANRNFKSIYVQGSIVKDLGGDLDVKELADSCNNKNNDVSFITN